MALTLVTAQTLSGSRAGEPAPAAPSQRSLPQTPGAYRYVIAIEQRAVTSAGRVKDEPHFGGVARTRGPLVRVDFDSATARKQGADWYVTRDAGRNVVLVDDRRRRVIELPVATLGDRVQEERRIRMRLTDVEIAWDASRPCGRLGEWDTQCIALRVRYRAHSWLSLVRDVVDVTESIEYRIVPALSDVVLPFESFYATRLDLLAHRDPGFARRWREALQQRPAGSVVAVSVRREERDARATNTIHRSITIDRLERAANPETLYDVPPAYRLAPR